MTLAACLKKALTVSSRHNSDYPAKTSYIRKPALVNNMAAIKA